MMPGRTLYRLPAAAGAGLPTLAASPAMAQTQAARPLLDFAVARPDNSQLLLLVFLTAAIFLAGYLIYRLLLKGSVQKGTHPSHLQASVWLWIGFCAGLSAMLLLPTVGQGWFLLVASLLTVASIFLLVGRAVVASAVGALLLLLLIIIGLRVGNLI